MVTEFILRGTDSRFVDHAISAYDTEDPDIVKELESLQLHPARHSPHDTVEARANLSAKAVLEFGKRGHPIAAFAQGLGESCAAAEWELRGAGRIQSPLHELNRECRCSVDVVGLSSDSPSMESGESLSDSRLRLIYGSSRRGDGKPLRSEPADP